MSKRRVLRVESYCFFVCFVRPQDNAEYLDVIVKMCRNFALSIGSGTAVGSAL